MKCAASWAILHTFQNDTAFRTTKGGENPDRYGGNARLELAASGLHLLIVGN